MGQHKEDIGSRKDLCLYRIQTAKDNLRATRILLAANEYRGQITGLIMRFITQYQRFMRWMENHINGIKTHLGILIRTMSERRFSPGHLVEG